MLCSYNFSESLLKRNRTENWLDTHFFIMISIYYVDTSFGGTYLSSVTIETTTKGFKKHEFFSFDLLVMIAYQPLRRPTASISNAERLLTVYTIISGL